MSRFMIWGVDSGNFAEGQIIWSALNAIRPAKNAGASIVDLSNLTLIRPYTATIVAALGCLSNGDAELVLPSTQTARDYAIRVGLSDFFRSSQHNPLSASPRSVRVQRLTQPSSTFADEISEAWEREFGSLPAGLRPRLADHLDEMIRNALAHANSPIGCLVAAQVYPERQAVEIAILDTGQTIRSHLGKNPVHIGVCSNDHEAIVYATAEGVSGTPAGSLNALGEPNSGVGLYELRRYCENGHGEVTILSGEAMVIFKEGDEPRTKYFAGGFPGCLVNIRFFV